MAHITDISAASPLIPEGARSPRMRPAVPAPAQQTWVRDTLVGTTVGSGIAALTQGLRALPAGTALCAPVAHVAMTTGAIVASFSHASRLRLEGGDPYHYNAWRAAGLGTAVAVPLLGEIERALGNPAANARQLDFSPIALALLASHIVLGGLFQQALDMRPTEGRSQRSIDVRQAALGGAFVLSIAAQVLYLFGSIGSHPAQALTQRRVLVDLGCAALGAIVGWTARAGGHENVRIGGFAASVVGTLAAVYHAA